MGKGRRVNRKAVSFLDPRLVVAGVTSELKNIRRLKTSLVATVMRVDDEEEKNLQKLEFRGWNYLENYHCLTTMEKKEENKLVWSWLSRSYFYLESSGHFRK